MCATTALNQYDIGDLVRIFTSFEQPGGPIDPDTVRLRVLSPIGVEMVYDYAQNEIIRTNVGAYHVDITPDRAGTWHYRWESTGAGQGAEEGQFYVRYSPFT